VQIAGGRERERTLSCESGRKKARLGGCKNSAGGLRGVSCFVSSREGPGREKKAAARVNGKAR